MACVRTAPTSHDDFWLARDDERTEARSRERAQAALALLASRGVRDGRLLDVGCGPGWALETFRQAGFDAVGVDASPVAVDRARSRGPSSR